MHYEIFKNLNFKELLNIRSLKLGGYQLTSNKILRERIKNYAINIKLDFDKSVDEKKIVRRIKLMFEQTGLYRLRINGWKFKKLNGICLLKSFQYIPETEDLILSTMILVYIYR